MKFTVTWLASADRAFMELWTSADDRQEITRTAETIDAVLSSAPQTKATPVDHYYFFRMDPLLVLVNINVDDRVVGVVHVDYVGYQPT